MRLGRWALLAVGIAAAACASTIGPVVPSIQVLVVLDSLDDALFIIPVDSPDVAHKVELDYNHNIGFFGKHALALRGTIGVASHGGSVVSFDVVSGLHTCDQEFTLSGGIASLAFSDAGVVSVASYDNHTINYFDPANVPCTRQTPVFIRGVPRAFVSARSILYAVAGNNVNAGSWLSSTSGQLNDNIPLQPADSTPLSPPGNAQTAVVGSDGLIYVINAGTGASNARLSQVNPVDHTELSVISGFGTRPQFIATDGVDRIFVAALEGMVVYNIRTNRVERDAQSAILLAAGTPRGLATDDFGRVYALLSGSCVSVPATPGHVQVFGADLVSTKLIAVGRCPVAIGVTDIPATLYHFDN